MPQHKDFKRLVRTRMEKTGESYTAARAQLLKKKSTRNNIIAAKPANYAKIAGMSDVAVEKATGCPWALWVKSLDYAKAADMSHRDIAKYVHEKFDVSAWWAQMITVGYERIRGLRDKGQTRGGNYMVNKSKTIDVPIEVLYRAFAIKRSRSRWLTDIDLAVKTSTANKSIRFSCGDGTNVDAYFLKKTAGKSAVQLQHGKLASKVAADKVRAQWTERLARLKDALA
jgi:hypothetical protein